MKKNKKGINLFEIFVNKELEKYNITFHDILKYPEFKIDGVDWFDHFTMTEQEDKEWGEWCYNFYKENINPRISNKKWKSGFELFKLEYGLKINNN